MKTLLPLTAALSLAAVLLSCRSCDLFDGRPSGPYAQSSLPDLLRILREQDELCERLDVRLAAARRCLDGKWTAAAQVMRGELTLLQAAAVFRDLQAAIPGYDWEHFRGHFAGDSDEERLCRAVIDFVGAAPPGEPEPDRGLLDRLEAELKSLRRLGAIRLSPGRPIPDPPSKL